MNIILITYMITMGLETAACTLVGQEIGANNLGEARKLFDSIMKVSTCMLLTTSLGLFVFKEQIVSILTPDEDIRKLAISVIWLISFNTFPDGFKGMMKGIIKALGLVKRTALIGTISYTVMAVPLAYLFTFQLDFGLKGIWMGLACGSTHQILHLFFLIHCSSWEKACEKAKER